MIQGYVKYKNTMKNNLLILTAALSLFCACQKPSTGGDTPIDVSRYREAIIGYWGFAEQTTYEDGKMTDGQIWRWPYEAVYAFTETDATFYLLSQDYDEKLQRYTRYESFGDRPYYIKGTSFLLDGEIVEIVEFFQNEVILKEEVEGVGEIIIHLKRCSPVNTSNKY